MGDRRAEHGEQWRARRCAKPSAVPRGRYLGRPQRRSGGPAGERTVHGAGPQLRRARPQQGSGRPHGHYAPVAAGRDRKSTRLNSSHEWISYAVFCLKKKNKQKEQQNKKKKKNKKQTLE